MKPRLYFLIVIVFGYLPSGSHAQVQPLPELAFKRRTDTIYVDSLAQLAKHQYKALQALPLTTHNDTLRLKTLYYLGRLAQWQNGHRDSTFYYGSELVRQARNRKNTFYEVAGKVLLEAYYHDDLSKTQEALLLNLEILTTSEYSIYDSGIVRIRALINLSDLYANSTDYINALRYLTEAKMYLKFLPEGNENPNEEDDDLSKGSFDYGFSYAPYFSTKTINVFRIDVNQRLGAIYNKQGNFVDSEKSYLATEILLQKGAPDAVQVFIYQTISELYLKYRKYKQALRYSKKADAIRFRTATRKDSYRWGVQACEYASTGRDDLAYEYAQKALEQSDSYQSVRKQAYMALCQVADHQQDWKNRSIYYKKYVATRDTMEDRRSRNDLASIEDKAVYYAITYDRNLDIEKNGRVSRMWALAILLIILCFILIQFFSVRLRKRQAKAALRLANERTQAQIIQSQESERERIAADLHDDLGGTLVAIRYRLVNLRRDVPGPETALSFDQLEAMIQQSCRDLRRISHNLMPPEFARTGLRSALEHLVRSVSSHPTRFTFVAQGPERKLPLDTELNLYRIASELIHNVLKHAQAGRAAVQVLYHPDQLVLLVEDDGVGNQSEKTAGGREGIGLKTSSLRADYIGARMRREASPSGTLVVVELPYPPATHATPESG